MLDVSATFMETGQSFESLKSVKLRNKMALFEINILSRYGMALKRVKLQNLSRVFSRTLTTNIYNAAKCVDVIPAARNMKTIH